MMEVAATSDGRGDESLSLPVASPLSVDAVAVDAAAGDEVSVDNNDNSNAVRNMAIDKEEEFVPDTPTSCNSINTIQVRNKRKKERKGK